MSSRQSTRMGLLPPPPPTQPTQHLLPPPPTPPTPPPPPPYELIIVTKMLQDRNKALNDLIKKLQNNLNKLKDEDKFVDKSKYNKIFNFTENALEIANANTQIGISIKEQNDLINEKIDELMKNCLLINKLTQNINKFVNDKRIGYGLESIAKEEIIKQLDTSTLPVAIQNVLNTPYTRKRKYSNRSNSNRSNSNSRDGKKTRRRHL